MQPLIDNEAFRRRCEIYKETTKYGPPDELNLGRGRHARPVHLRALRPHHGLGRYRHAGDRSHHLEVKDKVGAVITPGSTQVLDRATASW